MEKIIKDTIHANGIDIGILLTLGVNHQKESVSVDQKELGWNGHFQPI